LPQSFIYHSHQASKKVEEFLEKAKREVEEFIEKKVIELKAGFLD